MVLDVLCVVEDGARRGAKLPLSIGHTLRAPRGASVTVRAQVKYSSGASFDLTGADLRMEVRNATRNIPVIVKSADAQTDLGMASIILSPQNTDILPGSYVYDVWLEKGGGRERVVHAAPFIVEPALRLLSDG